MIVRTTRQTTGPDAGDVAIPAGTAGEVIGTGYEMDGVEYVAVDFGNVVCDVPVPDIEIVQKGAPATRDALMDVAQLVVNGSDDNAAVDALIAQGATTFDAHQIVADVKNHPVTREILRAKGVSA